MSATEKGAESPSKTEDAPSIDSPAAAAPADTPVKSENTQEISESTSSGAAPAASETTASDESSPKAGSKDEPDTRSESESEGIGQWGDTIPDQPVPDDSGAHQLETAWTIWFDRKPKHAQVPASTYAENLIRIGDFSSMEGFWKFYRLLVRPSAMPKDTNFHIMRYNLKPMWETFPRGGCFIKKMQKWEGGTHPALDRMWEVLLFAAIGEAFEDPDVVGVGLSLRTKEDALSIWNRDQSNLPLRAKIGEKLREIWELDPQTMIEYKPNQASIKDKSTYRTPGKPISI
eukprot:TRINITY_DN2259_c0_g1_i2.p1 TRINITY_DN2259_c0_g1~~TRINITY_DN2259_c0_g1_i2.p1  ORF type:complete len:307 (-),score=41.67 TRINITY_DN2259_c0_g1_i2:1100-1963(-)